MLLASLIWLPACDDGEGGGTGEDQPDAEAISTDGGGGEGGAAGEGGAGGEPMGGMPMGGEGGAMGGAGGEAPDAGMPDAEPDGAVTPCAEGETRPCPDDPCGGGTQVCEGDGVWAACQWPEDICNGADDDCDGATDEDFPELGAACTAGLGVCAVEGATVCAEGGAGVRCDAVVGEPGEEICDNLDNDCDGNTDEGADGEPLSRVCYGGAEGTAGVGACRRGVQRCAEGEFGLCEGEIVPAPELCTPGDEDCDGSAEEGFAELGEDCTAGVGACAAPGVISCAGDGASLECLGDTPAPGEEICNEVDDDCDGAVDEGVQCGCEPGEVQGCYGGPDGTEGVGRCSAGTQICGPDRILGPCIGEQLPIDEFCDGVDQDCDVRIDEGFPALGTPCTVGEGACAAEGIHICTPDGRDTRCDAQPALPGVEICNEVDDDCDGTTDEGLGLGEPCVVGVGLCASEGVRVCAPDGRAICQAEAGAASEEICNGEDDDCDGNIDEGPDGAPLALRCYAGPEGSDGVGLCAAGVRTCVDGALSACEGEVLPEDEICDASDNDCDGVSDEGFDVGAACSAGVGACAAEGVVICEPDGPGALCSATVGEPVGERCNGEDDDCDGTTDEGFEGVGEACGVGVGACAAEGVFACQPDGLGLLCDAELIEPASERCDGVDNDCDDSVDEGVAPVACYTGPVETRRVGLCADGAQACVGGGLGACEGEIVPAPEVCNGEDDDCDGSADEEEAPCYDGPEGTEGVGQCQAGSQLCEGGTTGACVAQVLPDEEICDGVDNDCDGDADEGLACDCEPGQRRVCYGGPGGTSGVGLCRSGSQLCSPQGEFGPCEGQVLPGEELCNGLDDDCNGEVDDAVAGVNQPCSAGQGECRAEGVTRCVPGEGVLCDAEAGQALPERCDGLDNDCDGTSDENLPIGFVCTAGLGACAAEGTLQCNERGGVTCVAPEGEPRPEVCNLVDDDCDGFTDEGENGQPLMGECYEGRAGTEGVGQCQAGVARCVAGRLEQCQGQVTPNAEWCDGLDNDCDGSADENYPTGLACILGVGACRAVGAFACGEDGNTVCAGETPEPSPEVCNSVDDDCDGNTDEGENGVPLSEACYNGPAGTEGVGLCRGGSQVCVNGGSGPCIDEVRPVDELCDGLDNDCDGEIDEDFQLGLPCLDGIGACVSQGVTACAPDGDGTLCDAPPGPEPGPELCDFLDNDCDGISDESFPNLGQNCVGGQGRCTRTGEFVCSGDGAGAVCSATPGDPEPEVCNGLDDDCDGITDEEAAGVNEPCSDGLGQCLAEGVFVCDPQVAELVCTALAGEPDPELCDGVDNDCDGATDEEALVGDPCVVGVGACRAEGVTICTPEGLEACSGQEGQPGDELCNGVDDDCDGATDEGFPGVGEACNGGVGRCAYDGTTICDAQGALVCSDPGRDPVTEACNNFDDDCDGDTDEDFQGQLGQACNSGVGACVNPGVNICSGAPNQEALSFTGVRTDLMESDLVEGGFTQCWAEPYEEGQTTIEAPNEVTGAPGILQLCDGEILLMGCRRVGEEGIPVAAMGERGAVLEETAFAERNPLNIHNGVNWYYNTDYSWGFAPEGARIDVFTCDRVVDEASDQRLCWYTSSDKVRPGYRCGADIVNASGLWERFIYQRSGNVDGGAVGVPVCDADPLPPGVEVCNGEDDDCDGANDEDFDLGAQCVAGVGACAADGRVACAEDGTAYCAAPVADPAPELCNDIDDDCDGATDEDFALESDCAVGVGGCVNAGELICDPGTGQAICDVDPLPPGDEVCNAFDDDCDGNVDEGVGACVIYPSCLAAFQAGEVDSGIYPIQPDPQDRAYEIWCDMQTDGGGWTTVAASAVPANGRGGTIDDRGVDRFDTLTNLAPQNSSPWVWPNMLALGDRFDIRFACRSFKANSSFTAMTVDLSFYDNGWYEEIASAEVDRDSCFNTPDEPTGPPPARRNNRTDEFIEANVPWAQGALVSEDSCADGGDFLVDFNDGGRIGDLSDGTDWGESNGARVCGQPNLGTGQWMILVREVQP